MGDFYPFSLDSLWFGYFPDLSQSTPFSIVHSQLSIIHYPSFASSWIGSGGPGKRGRVRRM